MWSPSDAEEGARMLARHRQSLILEDIRRTGSARVSELTQRLGVSDMTIRRDLEVLARSGLVEKVHGGAVLPGAPRSHEPGFEAKSSLEQPAKAAIANAAASLVTPGSAIGLSAGTTTFALAEQLLGIPGLTIVTNSVRVMSLFTDGPGADPRVRELSVVLTGGARTPSDALVGPVADHTKWGIVGLSSFADLDDVDTLITDGGLPDEARTALADRVGQLITADE